MSEICQREELMDGKKCNGGLYTRPKRKKKHNKKRAKYKRGNGKYSNGKWQNGVSGIKWEAKTSNNIERGKNKEDKGDKDA